MAVVLRLDTIFEFGLGAVLITAAIGSPADGLTMAAPASRVFIIAVGIILLPVGLGLLASSRKPSPSMLNVVAAGNALFALVVTVWLASGWDQFSGLGRLLAAVVVAGLAGLAIAELVAARRL